MEALEGYVDYSTRRLSPFRARGHAADAIIAANASLPRSPVLSGAMQVKR